MVEASDSSQLLQLGDEILLEVLAYLRPTHLVTLRLVSRRLRQLADDEVIWKQRLLHDFNYPLRSSARAGGWRQLYKGLSNPCLWVWGEATNARLGLVQRNADLRSSDLLPVLHEQQGMPFPFHLPYEYSEVKLTRSQLDAIEPTPTTEQQAGAGSSAKFKLGPIVELHPGGWSYVALTSEGHILAWGQLCQNISSITDVRPGRGDRFLWALEEPTLLSLDGAPRDVTDAAGITGNTDHRARAISCGGSHLVAIIEPRTSTSGRSTHASSYLALWKDWTELTQHSLAEFDLGVVGGNAAARRHIEQLEADFGFTSVLIHETSRPDSSLSSSTSRPAKKSSIHAWYRTWPHDAAWSVELPPLPDPPEELARFLADTDATSGATPQASSSSHRFVTRVGAGENFLVALTETGLVYKIDLEAPDPQLLARELEGVHGRRSGAAEGAQPPPPLLAIFSEEGKAVQRRVLQRLLREGQRPWTLLQNFCDPRRMRSCASVVWECEGRRELVRDSTRITHVSAHFRQFVVYSVPAGADRGGAAGDDDGGGGGGSGGGSGRGTGHGAGVVLLGRHTDDASSQPEVKPQLQGADIVKVVMGDYHYGALDAHGNVFTWGDWSKGALGTWDQYQPARPTQSRADDDERDGEPTADGAEGGDGGAGGGGAGDAAAPPGGIFGGLMRLRRARLGLAAARAGVPTPYTPTTAGPTDRPVRLRFRRVPRHEAEPRRVCFDFDFRWDEADQDDQAGGFWTTPGSKRGRDHFAFDIGFAGWHSGALTIDRHLLEPPR